jgi:hypothetical protein
MNLLHGLVVLADDVTLQLLQRHQHLDKKRKILPYATIFFISTSFIPGQDVTAQLLEGHQLIYTSTGTVHCPIYMLSISKLLDLFRPRSGWPDSWWRPSSMQRAAKIWTLFINLHVPFLLSSILRLKCAFAAIFLPLPYKNGWHFWQCLN